MPIEKPIKAYELVEKLISSARLEDVVSKSKKDILWNGDVKPKFVKWMGANGRSKEYIDACILYLDAYVKKISKAEDVVGLFERCKRGRHHLDRALRNLLNYYAMVEGYQEAQIEGLRKAIPRVKTGVYYREVSEDRVAETLRKLEEEAPMKYRVLYAVILDSGVRLAHAI